MSVDAVGSANEESYGDLFATFGTYLMTPFWTVQTYALRGEESRVATFAKRFFALVGTLFAAPFALAGYAFSASASSFRTLKGEAETVSTKDPSYFHLNACMMPGVLPALFGGMSPADARFEMLVSTALEQNADLLFFSECGRLLTSKLYERLKGEYATFHVDPGLNPLGMENGLFIASRLSCAPTYVPFTVCGKGDQWFYQRGFFALETDETVFLYTHLDPKERFVRTAQLDEICAFIHKQSKPCALIGDLNIDRLKDRDEYKALIARGFVDQSQNDSPTTTDNELVDYALLYGSNRILSTKLVETPNLSDHVGLKGEIS